MGEARVAWTWGRDRVRQVDMYTGGQIGGTGNEREGKLTVENRERES